MPVSDGYLTFVVDQLRSVLPVVRVRRMFGGIGLYAGELFFALIDDDTLYLKVDDTTRGDYEARGMPPFQPYEGALSMNYSQLPEEVLEERDALRPWVERAVDVARRAKGKSRNAKSPSTPKAATTPAKKRARTSTATRRPGKR